MNITTISPTIVPMEKIPLETPLPVSSPDKIDSAKKPRSLAPEDNRQGAKAEDKKSLSAKELKKVSEEMNEIMNDFKTSLGFSIREELNNLVVVEIRNRDTNELIKQIPSKELLAIKEKMEELTGLLLDHSV